jgi:hypothetical protein
MSDKQKKVVKKPKPKKHVSGKPEPRPSTKPKGGGGAAKNAAATSAEIKVVARPSPSVDHGGLAAHEESPKPKPDQEQASPPVNNQPAQNTTDLELAALADLDSKLLVATDRIGMVARFETPGFYWHGRPGTGKTHAVRATLEEVGAKYHYHKGYITAQGLLELMETHFGTASAR